MELNGVVICTSSLNLQAAVAQWRNPRIQAELGKERENSPNALCNGPVYWSSLIAVPVFLKRQQFG
jgi:hypothetical protein